MLCCSNNLAQLEKNEPNLLHSVLLTKFSKASNLKVKSENGEVFSDFNIARSQSKIVKTSNSEVNKSTLDDWLYGKIGGGGPEIMISNYYGNIYLRKVR